MTALPFDEVFSEDEGLDEPSTFMREVDIDMDNVDIRVFDT